LVAINGFYFSFVFLITIIIIQFILIFIIKISYIDVVPYISFI